MAYAPLSGRLDPPAPSLEPVGMDLSYLQQHMAMAGYKRTADNAGLRDPHQHTSSDEESLDPSSSHFNRQFHTGARSASANNKAAGGQGGKKTKGRVKIKMEFIDNKLRRYTTFSKRKTGIMKKAYELSTLTGTQVIHTF